MTNATDAPGPAGAPWGYLSDAGPLSPWLTMEANREDLPENEPQPAGSASPRLLVQRHPQLVALGLGLAIGVPIGLYIHRWWGSGLFGLPSVITLLAVLGMGLVGVVGMLEAARGHEARAAISFTLAMALTGGTFAGVALGPGFRGGADFGGTVTVHLTAPATADWIGQAVCYTEANSSDVSGLWVVTWEGAGSPTEGQLGFTDSGSPYFKLGSEGNYYDSSGSPRPQLDVRELATGRLAGEVSFAGLPTNGRGFLPAFPGQALDGRLSWSCDTTRRPPDRAIPAGSGLP